MSAENIGPIEWGVERDDEGHRTYHITHLVKTTDYDDGPTTVLLASGLPTIGATWAFGNDLDGWAFCLPNVKVERFKPREGEKGKYWAVKNEFSTKPLKRCQDASIENPLDEPQKVSGSFLKYTKPLEKDRNDKYILSSSKERISGLERDANYPTVTIEQNVASLGLAEFAEMIDKVNDAELWGCPERCIKLDNVSWERKVYGTCGYYFTRRLEFKVNIETWDLSDVADVGFMEYVGEGDVDDPTNYKKIIGVDENSNPKPYPLKDGVLNPDPLNDPQFLDPIEVYDEANFLTLGIPVSLES